MSLSRLALASLIVALCCSIMATFSAFAEDAPTAGTTATTTPAAAPTTPAPAAAAATTTTTATTTTAATPASTGAAGLPTVVGLDTDAAADAVSETFLTLTLAYFNQSYLGSGIFADTVNSEVYENEDSGELLGAQLALAKQVEEQILALAKAPGHDKDDLEVIEGFKKLAQLNRIQWETLQDVLGGNETKQKIWEEVRNTMLKELEKYADEEPADATATPAPPTTGPVKQAEKDPTSAALKGLEVK